MKNSIFILSFLIAVISFPSYTQPIQRVLFEVQTSTSCEKCGEIGMPLMKQIMETHGDKVIGASYYLSSGYEIFQIPECIQIGLLSQYERPSAAANRILNVGKFAGHIFVETHNWDSIVKSALQKTSPVDLKLKYEINEETRELAAFIKAIFYDSISRDIRFNVLITEDNIIYPQAGAGDDFIHNNVIRAMTGGLWGTEGSIPENIKVGDSIQYEYHYFIDTNWRIENLNVIGIVQYGNISDLYFKRILNCVLGDKTTNIKNSNNNKTPISIKAIPNPASDNISVKFSIDGSRHTNIDIYNILGEKIDNIFSGYAHSGSNKINYETTHLPPGIYIIKLQSGSALSIMKIIKQ